MFHLNDKLSGVVTPNKWKNLIAAFLNNLCGDGVVKVEKPDKPSPSNPPSIGIDIRALIARLTEAGFGGEGVLPFAVRTVTTGSGSAVTLSEIRVYLPSLTVNLSGQDWQIATGSSAGAVSAITGETGWYKVNGVQEGTLWLCLKRTDGAGGAITYGAKFKAGTLSTEDGIGYQVAVVSANGAVVQMRQPIAGRFTENSGNSTYLGAAKFYNGASATDNTSKMPNDGIPTGDARFALKTDTWHFGEGHNGCQLLVISRIEEDDPKNPAEHYLYFRPATVSETGMVTDIGAELGCVQILA